MKNRIFSAVFFLMSFTGIAQQNTQYNHYIFNQIVINPAYAGTKNVINVSGLYGSQWTGLNGAPTSQSISAEGPLYSNMGLGLHITNDKLGAQSQKSIYGSYAYKVKTEGSLRISLGLSMGASYYTLDGNALTEEMQNDPAIPVNAVNKFRFDSKFGVFVYAKKFYTGLSVSDLTSNLKKSTDLLVAGQIKHYYVTAGYVFDINEEFKFKPSFMIKEDFRAPTNIDLTAFFLYKNMYWLGATYRSGANIINSKSLDNTLRVRDGIIILAEVNITDKFRVGYAYTYTLTALNDFAGHEIMLGYYFPQKQQSKMLTPRFF